jgi:alanine dehydrogenase
LIPYIDESAVHRALDEKTSYGLARETFLLVARNKTSMPPKMYLDLPAGDFRAMPAFVGAAGAKAAVGVKWISVYPLNPKRGLPTVNGTILLNSPATGVPLAVIEANGITALRTGAAAALAARCLANPRPRKLAIVGAGLQAAYQLRAHAAQYRFERISVWGYLPEEAERFCARFVRQFPGLRPCAALRDCVADADIVVTCTSSRRPLVKRAWITPGAHVNAIGADAKGKQELDPALLLASKVVVDEWEQASHSGEINVPFSKGLFKKKHLYGELADVVSGKKKGRISPREITIFDSTGLAVLDVYFARHVYASLHEAGRTP